MFKLPHWIDVHWAWKSPLTLASGWFSHYHELPSLDFSPNRVEIEIESSETCCASHSDAENSDIKNVFFCLVCYLESLIILVKLKVNGHFAQDSDRQKIFLFMLFANPEPEANCCQWFLFITWAVSIYYLPCKSNN